MQVQGYDKMTALRMELALIQLAKKEKIWGKGRLPVNPDPVTVGRSKKTPIRRALAVKERDKIMEVLGDKRLTIKEIMPHFTVASESIRRALVELTEEGQVGWRIRCYQQREYFRINAPHLP